MGVRWPYPMVVARVKQYTNVLLWLQTCRRAVSSISDVGLIFLNLL